MFPGFLSGPIRYTSVITPTTLTASVTDYAPTGFNLCSVIRLATDNSGVKTLNSLAGYADGRSVTISNVGSTDAITILHDDSSTGTAAMRFYCPGGINYSLTPGGTVIVRYDATNSRWRVQGNVSGNGGSPTYVNLTVTGNAAITGNETITGNAAITGTLAVTGLTTFTTMPKIPVATVAATGTVQANAALVATGVTLATGANAATGVLLPTAAAGLQVIIKNSDAANAVLLVWPATNGVINAIAANTNFNMAAKTACMFIGLNSTNWITVPLVAS